MAAEIVRRNDSVRTKPNRDKAPSSKSKPERGGKKAHILWTRQETEVLSELIKARTPIRGIADILKKSEKAIRRKCEWLGVSSSTTYRRRGELETNPQERSGEPAGGPVEENGTDLQR
jgi:hypothetical protein